MVQQAPHLDIAVHDALVVHAAHALQNLQEHSPDLCAPTACERMTSALSARHRCTHVHGMSVALRNSEDEE